MMTENEWALEAAIAEVTMPNGEEFRPCPNCGNHLVEGEKEDEMTQWLVCLVCGFDAIK